MKLNTASRARLYALTAVACAIWLVQSVNEAVNTNTMWTWYNIIFTLCLVTVVGYCAVNAVTGWKVNDQKEEDKKDKHTQA